LDRHGKGFDPFEKRASDAGGASGSSGPKIFAAVSRSCGAICGLAQRRARRVLRNGAFVQPVTLGGALRGSDSGDRKEDGANRLYFATAAGVHAFADGTISDVMQNGARFEASMRFFKDRDGLLWKRRNRGRPASVGQRQDRAVPHARRFVR